MFQEASQGHIPSQSTSSLTQACRTQDLSGSQLVPDWSHTRVGSYYYSEPLLAFDSARETCEGCAPNYELPATRYIRLITPITTNITGGTRVIAIPK
ncbi:hypothetical protein PGT21_005199 [Puccinia graminis f. sp. tritici]|uniref:Uncharacterized protein n=1 Tax=Puccinia graminis f. sp. tritici TaxID=56615 RepID=A0A5B0QZQ0_PUCGR|nr:hypothetical protein PGT21_005199 [Puccinia graminis f. sp. tritici]